MKDRAAIPTVLIVGGDAADRAAARDALADGFDCLEAAGTEAAWHSLRDNFVQVLLCLGDVDGADCPGLFTRLRREWPETAIVAVTDTQDALADDHGGDIDHILHPRWSAAHLNVAVRNAARVCGLVRENERLSLEIQCFGRARSAPAAAGGLTGFETIQHRPGSAMAGLVATARQFATFEVPVLLIGEPGTGRATLAEAIHAASTRSDGRFVALDATGLSETVVTTALFGQRRQAGVAAPRSGGLVRKAEQGTLYLSGLETLSRGLQQRVLRLVRDGTFEQDGSGEPQAAHVRVIAAIDARPDPGAADPRLDPALYYALAVAELTLPPLRDRAGDIPALAQELAVSAGRRHGKTVHGLTEPALEFLTAYPWPGNLRELENEITRMLICAQHPMLDADLISRHILQSAPARIDPASAIHDAGVAVLDGTLKDRVEAIEARILRETLTRLRWNKSRSAAELGLSRVGLRAKLERYGITQPQSETEDA